MHLLMVHTLHARPNLPDLRLLLTTVWALLLLPILPAAQSADPLEELVPGTAEWRFYRGTQNPAPTRPTAWRLPAFDDNAWDFGANPLYYGEPLTGTELVDMRGNYSSVYLRHSFEIASPADIRSLTLELRNDDGFVAYLNGNEIARYNVPEGELPHNATALGAAPEPLELLSYPVPDPASRLVRGPNTLAIHAFNVSLGDSSDLVVDARLTATLDRSPPRLLRTLPVSGATLRRLDVVEVFFTEPVAGIDREDLLVNGQQATSVAEMAPDHYLFTFDSPAPGTARIQFSPRHGIHDRAASPHAFDGAGWRVTVDPNAPPPGLEISEFMASNRRTLRDEDGDSSDWIELLNESEDPISLEGWALTDDPARPNRWRFPAITVQPHAFLVVMASGKNRAVPTLPLHTNFKLSSDPGGFLSLVSPAGTWRSTFSNHPVQLADVAYGRAEGAPTAVGYFPSPTPGTHNTLQGDGFAPPVEFSEPSRTFSGTLLLTLRTSNQPATIRFTTDGSLPTQDSPAYSQPIPLRNATLIRARAFADPLLPGPPRSEMFLPLARTLETFSSDLPILVLHDFDQGRPPVSNLIPAFLEVFEPGTNGLTRLTNAPTLATRAGIAARGSSTAGLPKASLKLELQDDFNADLNRPLLGLPPDSDWVLYGPNAFEPILIHNPFAHQLSRDIGRYSPRTRFVEVFLASTGAGPLSTADYQGIYVLEEKIKIGPDRVDIPKLQPQHLTTPTVTGGYLLKIDRLDPGDGGLNTGHVTVNFVDPKEPELEEPARAAQYNYIRTHLRALDTALYSASYRDPTRGYRPFIDQPAWIDHHLLNVLTFNVDALRLSTYLYKDRDGRIAYGPLWDFDRALNSTDGRDADPERWSSPAENPGTDFFNHPWWDRLFSDPDFFQAYIDRYQDLRTSAFSTTNLHQLVDTLTSQVRRSQPRDAQRWGISPRGGFNGEILALKQWLTARTDFIDSQFVAPPRMPSPQPTLPPGSAIPLEPNGPGEIYFTTDGSDPRSPGGAIAPTATPYTSPVAINQNTRLIARTLDRGHSALTGSLNPPLVAHWSGPATGAFVVTPLSLLITEIMYHPRGDGPDSPLDSDDFEFIELKNNGNRTVPLHGCRITGTIEFTFAASNAPATLPPGARLVIPRNRTALLSRHPGAPMASGNFAGKLDNNGGRLAVIGTVGEVILDFRYSNDWAPATDGPGHSLILRSESIHPSRIGLPEAWTASRSVDGSPGSSEDIFIELLPEAGRAVLRVPNPSSGASAFLETATRLSPPDWTPDSRTPTAHDGHLEFQIPYESGLRFYRAIVR